MQTLMFEGFGSSLDERKTCPNNPPASRARRRYVVPTSRVRTLVPRAAVLKYLRGTRVEDVPTGHPVP
jgi:hypothetical protein